MTTTIFAKEELIRSEILDEAGKLFRRFGLQKTTMDDIARAVGKGKSTLYYYFRNKEEILFAVLQHEKNAIFRKIQEAVSKADTAVEKMEAFMRSKMRELKKMQTLYQAVVEGVSCKETEMSIRRNYDSTEMDILKSILQYGVITGEFRNFDQHELDMIAFLIMSSQQGIEIALLVHNENLDQAGACLHFLADLYMNGLRNPGH